MANSIHNKFHTEISLLFLSLFLLFLPPVANSYTPDYNLAINCGNPENSPDPGHRIWVGDKTENSNLFSFIEPKTTTPSVNAQPDSQINTQIPYTTARISLSNFTYSFPSISSSPVFIRLHFHPTTYKQFEPSNALFSVRVNNNLTLLNNFNPLRWLRADDEEKITKEYCIQIKPNEKLDITFIPNNINQSNVYYAFINGIEVVSMPSFLYYTNHSDTNYDFKLINFENNDYTIDSDRFLETVYRVNVGSNEVAANDDTGMFRYWEVDYPRYLEKQYTYSISADFGHHLNYVHNTVPNYTAPEAVYLTARSYGMDATEEYNVTWNFEVDYAFTYMVRLHFCEFETKVNQVSDRVFRIFIHDIFAERYADVIKWSGGNKIPVHKDYAVTMYPPEGSSPNERVNLTIKLQRAQDNTFTRHRDVILNGLEIFKLNGLEIFKLNDTANNLAGLNPSYSTQNGNVLPTSQPKPNKSLIFKVAVPGVSCLLLALVVVGIIVFLRRRRRFESHPEMKESSWKTRNEGSSTLPSHLSRYHSYIIRMYPMRTAN